MTAFIAPVAWVVCHKVEELRSKYDAEAVTCIFNIFFWCISAKAFKIRLEDEKRFVEIKPVSVVEHVEI